MNTNAFYYVTTTPTGHSKVTLVEFLEDQPFAGLSQRKTRSPNTIKGIHHPPGGAGVQEKVPRQIHFLRIVSGCLEFTIAAEHGTETYRIGTGEEIQGVIFADWEEVEDTGGHSSRNDGDPVKFWLTVVEAENPDDVPKLPLREVEK